MSTHDQRPMIYTIGYGNRTPEEFVRLLNRYQVACLIDVRSYPYSQHQPWFSRDRLHELLKEHGIQYVWLGHLLGDKPIDAGCYTRGRLDYAKYRDTTEFKQGVLQLQSAWNARVRFALMSQTLRPSVCHRAKLIAEALVERGLQVAHIDEGGRLQRHAYVHPRHGETSNFVMGSTHRKRNSAAAGQPAQATLNRSELWQATENPRRSTSPWPRSSRPTATAR